MGFRSASGELIAMIDGDGSMDANEIPRFFDALIDGADVAKGTRYGTGGSEDLTLFRDLGNRVLTRVVNSTFGVDWDDLAYGFAAFRKSAILRLNLDHLDDQHSILGHKAYGQGFEIETLLFCRSSRLGLKVVEVPSVERARIAGASNLRAVRDGFRVCAAIVAERVRDPR